MPGNGVGFVQAGGHRLEVARVGEATERAPIVLLHEGLGSVSVWRDFPGQLAQACGREVVVYSRVGYGRSEPLRHRHAVDYMDREANVVLPELCAALGLRVPVLVGHSDGASIALIRAGSAPDDRCQPAAIAVMAPHVFVEPVSLASIAAAREAFATTDLKAKLGRYHDDPEGAFRGWNDIWLDPAFAAWNIEARLPSIACPVLAIQGEQDEYGTMAQLDSIAARAPRCEQLRLTDCRHSPHRDQPQAVLAALQRFCAAVP